MAVGRYQHAHAASTYSYTLALSRSPSPSSLLYSFLQPSYPLVLSPFHLPCLPSSHMSPFFFPSQPFAPIIILPFVSFFLSRSFFLSLLYPPFSRFSSKHYLSFSTSLIFTLTFHDFSFFIFLLSKIYLFLISYRRFSLHVFSLFL